MAIRLITRDSGGIVTSGGTRDAERILRQRRGTLTIRSLKNWHEYVFKCEEIIGAEIIEDAEFRKIMEGLEKAKAEAAGNGSPN